MSHLSKCRGGLSCGNAFLPMTIMGEGFKRGPLSPQAKIPALVACCLLLLVFEAAPVGAVTILDVGGDVDYGQTIEAGEAVAVAFTLTQSFTNVSLSADIVSLGGQGGLWLQSNELGPGASYGDLIDGKAFESGVGTPFFSGIDLEPGLYFLILSIDEGSAIWPGSLAPTIFEAEGATRGLDFRTDDTQPWVPFSDFYVIFGGALHYTVEGEYPDCIDVDEDGFGDPANPTCTNPELDCNDSNFNIFPTNPNTYCDCEEPYPQGTDEICGDGIDNNCDGGIDEGCGYSSGANAQASTYGGGSLTASGSFNALALLLVPVGAVIALRMWRRRR